MLKSLCKYVEDNLPQFVRGTTLQEGHRLETAPDRCTTFILTGGNADMNSYYLKNYGLRILCRSASFNEARMDSIILMNFFHVRFNISLPTVDEDANYRLQTSSILSPPQLFNIDDKKRYEFETNLVCLIYKL